MYDEKTSLTPEQKLTASLYRSSLDVRVMDYLPRDSHHTGIPAGAGLDIANIIDNIMWSEKSDQVGIRREATFSVEHLLCARYWMFARLYWSRYNRSATTMLRHVVHGILNKNVTRDNLYRRISLVDEAGALDILKGEWEYTGSYADEGSGIVDLLQRARPKTFPVLQDFFSKNWADDPEISRAAVKAAESLDSAGQEALGREYYDRSSLRHATSASDILFDVPREHPRKLGEDLFVEIGPARERKLDAVSDLVAGLPGVFFDTVVRVRVFVHPRHHEDTELRSRLASEVAEFLKEKFLVPQGGKPDC